MASIRKPKGAKNWEILFYYNGRKYHKSLRVSNKRDAETLKQLIERKLAEGIFDPSSMLQQKQKISRLFQLCERWERYLDRRNDITPETKREYYIGSRLIRELCGDVLLSTITPAYITDDLLLELGDRYTSPATIKSKMVSFRSMFSYAERQGIVQRNPFSRLVPGYKRRKPVFFREEEIELYRGYWMDSDRVKWQQTYFMTILYTGTRKMEHFKLTWSENVFLDEKVIKFVGKGSRGGKERIVPLSDQAIEMFVSAQRKLGEDRVFWQVRNKYAINSAWETFRKKTGWPHKLHATRSNYATKLIRSGVPLQDVMDIMGWEDYSTAKIYLGYSPEFVERHRNKATF